MRGAAWRADRTCGGIGPTSPVGGSDGSGHADAIFNPAHRGRRHGRRRTMLDAFDAGFAEVEQDGAPRIGPCGSLLRTQTAQQAVPLVDAPTEWRHPRVVALSPQAVLAVR
jgi:adenosine deaminase